MVCWSPTFFGTCPALEVFEKNSSILEVEFKLTVLVKFCLDFWQSAHYFTLDAIIDIETLENLLIINGLCWFQKHHQFMKLGQTKNFVEVADSKLVYFDVS